MGSRYLTDLANVVRGAGLVVQEEPGWQSRSRGSGGYSSGLPNAVMIHHTASGPSSDGQPDVSYMCYSADARPIANLYLSRQGKVWVMAAGATNTNGSGGPLGPVPADSMNSSAIGIEAGNNGTGSPGPTRSRMPTPGCVVRCVTTMAFRWAVSSRIASGRPVARSTRQVRRNGRHRAPGTRTPFVSRAAVPAPLPHPSEEDDMAVAITAPTTPAT